MTLQHDAVAHEFQAAQARLRGADMDGEDIHQFRVSMKRLRSYLRLFPTSARRKAIDRQLRDIARQFAGHRDRDVMRQTLSKRISGKEIQSLYADLGLNAVNAQDNWQSQRESASAQLERAELHWQRDLGELTPERIRTTLPVRYRECRRQGKKVLRKSDDEALHEWRKTEKYLLYQCELCDTEAVKRLAKHLKKLGSKLGNYHDLVVLDEALDNAGHSRKMPLRRQLKREKRELMRKIRRRYRKAFKRSRKQFASLLPVTLQG